MTGNSAPQHEAGGQGRLPTRQMAILIAAGYALVAGLWILLSGIAVHRLVPDGDLEAVIETLKGWLFVSATALLLGWYLDRYFRELRLANRRLQASEQRWQFALDGAGDGVWDWDTEAGTVFYSNRWKSMLGYAPHEIGATLSEWESRVHPEDLPRVMAEVQRHFRGETRSYQSEHRIRCKDGSYKWVLDRGCVMSRTPAGLPLRVVGTHTDVTERKHAEAVVAEEAVRRRILVEESTAGIVVLDEQGGVVEVNRRFAEMLGYPLAEAQHLRIWDWDLQWGREQLLEKIRSVGHDGVCFETRHRRKDGTAIDVEVSSNGAMLGGRKLAFCVCRDVSRRKRAELELKSSEERFRMVVETAPEAIFIRTGECFAYLNAAALRLFGARSAEELVGERVADRFHPEHRADILERMRRLDDHGERATSLGQVYLRLDGSTVHVVVSAAPFTYRGEPGALVFARDVSGEKRLEAQLRQAQKLEAVGQLAGGVAHDFNNILAAIMMHLGLLKLNPDLDADVERGVEELESSAQRAADLTRQLLMFGRRSVLAIKPLDLNEVVANLLKMLARLIGEQHELRFDRSPALPLVNADAGMMEQVLMNLVVNARDAMARGGRITITTSVVRFDGVQAGENHERRVGEFVCLGVTDAGCGMDEATLKRIFEPFFTTKEAGRGTGLGLATAHGIVAQHGGWIEVVSQLGQGSTFNIFFPALPVVVKRLCAAPAAGPVRRGRETILVVEDEERVRQLLCQSLRVLGYRVYEARNGREAMARWGEFGSSVDLLLTDMVMPEGLTGLELAEHLVEQRPQLKVIISSGYSHEIAQAGVPTRAGVRYLAKPYQVEVLARVVRECFEGVQAQ